MMGQPTHPVEELPGELAERLNRLAAVETAGSHPWPGVDLAVRRSHRRRVAGVSGLAAGVLVAGAVFGSLLNPSLNRTQPAPPAVTPSVTATPPGPLTTEQAGLTGAIGGSLATDGEWLNAVRDKVIAASRPGVKKPVPRSDVLLLWAGDLNGARYAVVEFLAPASGKSKQLEWNSGTLTGPLGASAAQMQFDSWTSHGTEVPDSAETEYVKAPAGAGSPAVVFSIAPKAGKVEVARGRRFGPDGKATTSWRPLQKQGGAVWAGPLSADEYYLFEVRVTGMESDGTTGTSIDAASAPAAIAAPGTDLKALAWASDQAHFAGASLAERPVLAASAPLGGRNTLAATVLRSPDGGYLYGLAEEHVTDAKDSGGVVLQVHGISAQPFDRPEAFMAAVRVNGDEDGTPLHPGPHYLVITPAGADSIRVRGVTTKVHDRLAVLDVPPVPYTYDDGLDEDGNETGPADPPDTVEALDADGNVLGTVQSVAESDEGDEQPGRPSAVVYYFGDTRPS